MRGRGGISLASAAISLVLLAAVTLVAIPAGAAPTTVDCHKQDLQSKIAAASPGATLLVKGTCIGNFVVGQAITLQGNPTATLDGDDAGSTLTVNGSQDVHLIGLTITGGFATDKGGGIDREGTGSLILDGVTVQGNVAQGSGGNSSAFVFGGGIFSAGPLEISGSSIVDNLALANSSSDFRNTALTQGGGVYAAETLTLLDSVVSFNRSIALAPVDAEAQADGGGVATSGTLVISKSHVDDNLATASSTQEFAQADGGGIEEEAEAPSLQITSSTVDGNAVKASGLASYATAAGLGAAVDTGQMSKTRIDGNRARASSSDSAAIRGGAVYVVAKTSFKIVSSQITNTVATVSAGTGATVEGVGIDSLGPLSLVSTTISSGRADVEAPNSAFVTGGGIDESPNNIQGAAPASLSLTKSTIDHNVINVTSTGADATGDGGGIASSVPITVSASTVSRNSVSASTLASDSAESLGGGLYLSGGASQAIRNSTVTENTTHATAQGPSGDSTSEGGGVYTTDPTTVVDSAVARNTASGFGDTASVGGGGLEASGGSTKLKASILALNSAPGGLGQDCFGNAASQGFNVVQATDGCPASPLSSDVTGKNPKLGILGNNGGPTMTLALLSGSPAIDVMPPPCPVKADQRGVKRPQGSKCDIGSFELKP